MKVQRLRLTFARRQPASDMSPRDTMRALEQAAREAGLPLAYSEGRRPTAQISVAAPLPAGATSCCELADVYLSERVPPRDILTRLKAALPPGLEAVACEEVGLGVPALQAEVRWAEYEVDVPRGGRSPAEVRQAIDDLLASRSLPWEHRREKGVRRYDLRLLVLALTMEPESDDVFRLAMRLRIGQERSGRADQVVAALGLHAPVRVHRRALRVETVPPAVRAYRLAGEPAG